MNEHRKNRREGLLDVIPGSCQALAIGCAESQSSENGSRPPNKDVTAPSCTLSCLVSARSGGAVPARPLLGGLRGPELWSRRAGCRRLGDLLIELVSEGDSARRVAYGAVDRATISSVVRLLRPLEEVRMHHRRIMMMPYLSSDKGVVSHQLLLEVGFSEI